MPDTEDLGTLGQMLELGAQYIDDQQDDPADAANIPAMQDALRIIADLVPVEAAEPEPPAPTA